MSKPKNIITEFRNYRLPVEFPILLLTGSQWRISDVPSERLHFHNCLEIGYCHEGSGTLQIQKEKLSFGAGDLTCIARNIPHTTYSNPGTTSRWSYLFTEPQELLDSFAPKYQNQLSQLFYNLGTAMVIPAAECEDLHFYFEQIVSGIQAKENEYQLKVRADFLALGIRLASVLSSRETALSLRSQASTLSIVPALEYIKNHFMNAISMNELAQLCGLSPTHFRRIFHQAMGTAPLEYLNSVRINKACYLLKSTEDSVLNISENVGFHSISSFNRYFIRIVGMTPREYRNSDTNGEQLQRTTVMKYNGWLEPEI